MLNRFIFFVKGTLNKNVLIIVFMLLMALSVYLWGSRMGYRGIYPLRDTDMRLFVVMVILLAAALFTIFLVIRWVWRFVRNRKKRVPREPSAEEIEEGKMDALFASVIKTMTKRWEGRGSPVKNMPWYIVLGAENSGKTTLIENANLRFPLDHDIKSATKKIGNSMSAKFVDWRVSGKEAVLLDVKGENFSSAHERDEMKETLWNSFLKNLRKTRQRKPLNGAVVVIDVLEFAQSGHLEREAFAEKTRQQLSDVVEKLGSRLPVYIVFTKLDLISGFNEFHSVIPAEEREKIFGFHFAYRQDGYQDWQEQLEGQINTYLDEMVSTISSYLNRIPSKEGRREAYAFYRTMYGLEAPLKTLLETMFDEDKFSTQPLVRGVYFTSAKQENAPENLFLDVVSNRYALPAPVFAATQGRSKALFAGTLFQGQIFPEAELAGRTKKSRRKGYRRNAFAMVLSSIVGVGIMLFWFGQYFSNVEHGRNLVNDVREYEYSGVEINPQTPPEFYLPALGLAREAATQFAGWREKSPLLATLTLYQGKKLGPYGDYVYLTALNRQYMPTLTDIVGDRLRGVCPYGSEEELRLLRVYRMLGEPDRRNDAVIEDYFSEDWARQYPGDNYSQTQLNGHLQFALNYSDQAYPTDQSIIQVALSHLGTITPSQRVYSALRARANATMDREVNLAVVGGANFAFVYENVDDLSKGLLETDQFGDAQFADCRTSYQASLNMPLEVQEFFTAHGFRDFFSPNIEKITDLATADLWVFDDNNRETVYSDADFAQIQQASWGIYTGEYVDAWNKAIDDLKMRPIQNLTTAVVVTEALGSQDSPIRRIAEAVSRETIIFSDEDQQDLDATQGDTQVAGLNVQTERLAASDIRRSFVDIQNLTVPISEGTPPAIDAITDVNNSLSRFLGRMANDPEPHKRALEFAIGRANGTMSEDPIDNLRRVASDAPEPFRTQLMGVADQTWAVILQEASIALNERWQGEIYSDYTKYIAGRYPINRKSGEDLPVPDFTRFFQPGGSLDQFYSDQLSPFVDVYTGEPRAIDGQYLRLDPAAIAQLNAAHEVTTSFFDPSGQLAIQFSVAPISMSRGLMRSVLNIEGQTVVYAHGPSQTARIVWPNTIGGTQSRIDMSGNFSGGSSSVEANGIWSWLRLIDKGSREAAGSGAVNVSFFAQGGQGVTYRFQSETDNNPLLGDIGRSFSLPEKLSIEPIRAESIEDVTGQIGT